MVLSGEDVAGGPGELGTESLEGLDKDGSLDSFGILLASRTCGSHTVRRTHVQATSDAGALQWLLSGVLLTGGHETWHLVLGELDLAATEGGQRKVSDLELLSWGRHCVCDMWYEVMREGIEWDVEGQLERSRKKQTMPLAC